MPPKKSLGLIQRWLARILLLPFSLLYGLGVALRNFCYRQGVLKSMRFDIPTISVGNLSVGGAGKTPHTEYLVGLLKEYINVATLSRGYKRKTRGFRAVHPRMTAEQVGDEPLQFKRKYPDVGVYVAEDRAFAIPQIISGHPETQVILMDDAYQHRAVEPGLNILLTDHSQLFTRDWLLPSGRLREWRSGYRRADVIIVTKCPPELDRAAAQRLREEISPLPHQQLFFTTYDYGTPYYIFDPRYRVQLDASWDAVVVSAIANTDYLLQYIDEKVDGMRPLSFPDHHFFTPHDLGTINRVFAEYDSQRKLILTTEKDATRLEAHRAFIQEKRLPLFALPVRVRFLFDEGPAFDQLTREYLLNFKV